MCNVVIIIIRGKALLEKTNLLAEIYLQIHFQNMYS